MTDKFQIFLAYTITILSLGTAMERVEEIAKVKEETAQARAKVKAYQNMYTDVRFMNRCAAVRAHFVSETVIGFSDDVFVCSDHLDGRYRARFILEKLDD